MQFERSYFIPPANAFRARSPMLFMQATEQQRLGLARIVEWADGYPAHVGVKALDACEVLCMTCRRRSAWSAVKGARICLHCGNPFWEDDVWRAAHAALLITGDFELFNQVLRGVGA